MRSEIRSRALTLSFISAWLFTSVVAATDIPARDRVFQLGMEGRSSANPSAAAAGAFVALAWAASVKDGPTDVYVAVSRNSGRTFGAPVRVNDIAGDARVSGEQPPRVSLVVRAGVDPSIVIVWTAKGENGTRLLTSQSNDGGRSFARARPVSGGDAAGNRGWEATTLDRDGQVVAVWLDHRELSASRGQSMPHEGQQHTGHAMPADGAARAQLSKLYFGRVDGSDSPRAIASGVCYCCKTAIATAPDGSIYAAWRHVYPGNTRDIAFTVSRDSGRTFLAPLRVSDDRWVLDGCPENGPAMAIDRSNRVHLVWPTIVAGSTPGSEPTLALFHATSADGRHFSTRERIPTEGLPRHPELAIDSTGALIAVWDEQENGTRRVVLARAAPNGAGPVRFTRDILAGAGTNVYPALVPVADGVAVAWTAGPSTGSLIRVMHIQ